MTKLSSTVDSNLSDEVIEQLQRKNIYTVIQFMKEDSEKLLATTGLSPKNIFEIKKNILRKYRGTIKNAYDLHEIENNNIVPTKLKSLDNILEGGLYPGQIYEICGISASGKTQLCLTIAANVSLTPHCIVRYIDTKRDFCASRVEQILLKTGCDKQITNEILERIKICCIYSFDELLKVLQWLTVSLKEEQEEFRTRIIIIDSLPAIIFKCSRSHETTIALNHLANICHFIANEFHLSIISVNLITQWSTDSKQDTTSEKCSDITPTLGKYWTRVPNTRLLLEKTGPGYRKLLIWKSHQLEENLSCNLTITDSGIVCC